MTTNLTKQELIAIIAEKAAITQKQAAAALDASFATIQEGLCQGRKFTMTGFGTFSLSARQPRAGVNPRTGQPIVVPGKLVARFKAGKRLIAALNSIESISQWVKK